METHNVIPPQAQGALRPGRIITWLRDDDAPENLTNATITGTLRSRTTGVKRAISGTLLASDPNNGVFVWSFSPDDVSSTDWYDVQFTAAFPSGDSPAKTFTALWQVTEGL